MFDTLNTARCLSLFNYSNICRKEGDEIRDMDSFEGEIENDFEENNENDYNLNFFL